MFASFLVGNIFGQFYCLDFNFPFRTGSWKCWMVSFTVNTAFWFITIYIVMATFCTTRACNGSTTDCFWMFITLTLKTFQGVWNAWIDRVTQVDSFNSFISVRLLNERIMCLKGRIWRIFCIVIQRTSMAFWDLSCSKILSLEEYRRSMFR